MKKKVFSVVMAIVLVCALFGGTQVFAGVTPYEAYNFAEPDDYEQDEVNEFHSDVLKFEGAEQSNVGGTFDGAWLEYDGFSFGTVGAVAICVNYCNNSGRCASDSQIEVWIDAMTTEDGGTKVAVVDLPATGGDWNTYVDTEVALDSVVTGDHDVFMVLLGTTSETNPFISNLRVFEFVKGEGEEEPTAEPTEEATATPEPTEEATLEPTEEPTQAPTVTAKPTEQPTTAPVNTATPSDAPETPENDSTVMIVVIVVIAVVVLAAIASIVILKKKK